MAINTEDSATSRGMKHWYALKIPNCKNCKKVKLIKTPAREVGYCFKCFKKKTGKSYSQVRDEIYSKYRELNMPITYEIMITEYRRLMGK